MGRFLAPGQLGKCFGGGKMFADGNEPGLRQKNGTERQIKRKKEGQKTDSPTLFSL